MTDAYRPRREHREAFVSVRGLDHCLHSWGPAEAEPVLLLHGWGDTGATFQFLVDALAGGHRLVAPDWRGFGKSAWCPGGYWFPDYLADLDVLLDRLDAAPARILGQSMGGNVAALYAGVRPERVRALMLVEGFGLPDSTPAEAPGRYRRWLEDLQQAETFRRYPSVDALAGRLLERTPGLGAERARFVAEAWSRPDETGCVLRADPAHKRVNPVLYRRAEAEACWQAVTAPVLLVAGEQSPFRPLLEEATGPAAGLFRGARREVIRGAGHMVHHEQPERLAEVVERFLAAQDGVGPEPVEPS